MRLSSDGSVITTIASAHYNGGAKTIAIAPGGDHGRAAGDAGEGRGHEGLGKGHRRQDRGEPPGQHRLACPRGAEQEDVWITTPASGSASPWSLEVPTVCHEPAPNTGALVSGTIKPTRRAAPWPPAGQRSQ